MQVTAPTLTKLPVKELAKRTICDGHLYLSAGGRQFYVMRPGMLIDESFIKKHAVTNQIFDFQSVTDSTVKEEFLKLFVELRYLQFEKDIREKCLQILGHFQKVYSGPEHFLSFALACHEGFCQIPMEDQKRMHETDMLLYRKALYTSAFSVVIGMANEFYNYLMLRDFYNLSFTLDIGLCENNYSYFVAQACNEENRHPGKGKELLLRERASEHEVAVFLNHPEKSYSFLKSSAVLTYPELAEISRYQHELADGGGFPRGIPKSHISSWEATVVLADALVEILPEYEFENKVVSYLTSFSGQKTSDLPIKKVYRKLCLTLSYLEEQERTGS